MARCNDSPLAALVLLLCLSLATPAAADSQAQAASQAALMRVLKSRFPAQGKPIENMASTATRFRIGWIDLNGDGEKDAVVYVFGEAWCGSGGCNLLILERHGRSFRVRGDLTIARLPVAALAQRNHGWRDLTVVAGGGGILPYYTAVIPFDGTSYAANPTVAPARKLPARVMEEVIIPSDIYPYL